MPYVLSPNEDLTQFDRVGGGKARQLAALTQAQFPIPAWFCVTTEVYDHFLEHNQLNPTVGEDEDPKNAAIRVEQLFMSAKLPNEIVIEIQQYLTQHGLMECDVAVRSSGLGEDSTEHSFAGQFETFLHQRGWDQIETAIRRCFASSFSERIIAYRRDRCLPHRAVAVVIQKMVSASSAGVSFSRNPVHPLDRDSIVVSSVWGLGEGLVSGLLEADEYMVSRDNFAITSRQIARKRSKMVRDNHGGTTVNDLNSTEAEASSLSDIQLVEVARLTKQAEEHFAAPQDCEWAFEGEKLLFLQSRRITTLPPLDYYRDPERQAILWDNSNIIESYCGVTTPLTFSFVEVAYKQVYIQFCEVMGVPKGTIESHSSMFQNMLGLLRGRVYYNLINWYRLLHLMPFSSGNGKFMETMMGVKQTLNPELSGLFDFLQQPVPYSLPRKSMLYSRLAFRLLIIRGLISKFNNIIKNIYAEHGQRDYSKLNLQQIVALYHDLVGRVLMQWKAPIVNDFRVMMFFGLIKSLAEKWLSSKDNRDSLVNDLLVGEGDLESTEPTKMLMRIAAELDLRRQDEGKWLLERTSEQASAAYFQNQLPQYLNKVVKEFLSKYGFRCVNELKLEEFDLFDNPDFVFEAIRAYVQMKTYSVEKMEARERTIRTSAEKQVKEQLHGIRRWIFFMVLKHARASVRDRENLRFARTKIYGIARKIFVAMGHRLVRLDKLNNPRDVFYLTVPEMISFVEGRAVDLDLAALVSLRKRAFASYQATPPPPDRFLTWGPVGTSLEYPQVIADGDLLKDIHHIDDPNTLKGISCCPGVVEGVVRVVRSLDEARGLAGEILVTERTDPGWVPLYPSCSGLLIERGSLLSHSAVVARELGLPTIVSISGGLMLRLKTGMKVRVDAGAGIIQILSSEDTSQEQS